MYDKFGGGGLFLSSPDSRMAVNKYIDTLSKRLPKNYHINQFPTTYTVHGVFKNNASVQLSFPASRQVIHTIRFAEQDEPMIVVRVIIQFSESSIIFIQIYYYNLIRYHLINLALELLEIPSKEPFSQISSRDRYLSSSFSLQKRQIRQISMANLTRRNTCPRQQQRSSSFIYSI